MPQQHLQPNPPTDRQSPGNRSPRVGPPLSSPHLGAFRDGVSFSSPPSPAHVPDPSARPTRASVGDVPATANWAAPVHSRSPVPASNNSSRRESSTTARTSDRGQTQRGSSQPQSSSLTGPPTSAAAVASRMYRGEASRVGHHGLAPHHAVRSYRGVLSPPSEEVLAARSLQSPIAAAGRGLGQSSTDATQLALGSLNDSLVHHYTRPRPENSLFSSSTSGSDPAYTHDGHEQEMMLESPTEITAQAPSPSGAALSGADGTAGLASCSKVSHDAWQDELDDFFASFISRLPVAWSTPLLRALTLQVATENVPSRVLTVSAVFDLYDDVKGELLGQLRFAQKAAQMAALASVGLQSPRSPRCGDGSGGSPELGHDLLSSTQPPDALRQRASGQGPLHISPEVNSDEDTAPARFTLDLYRLYSVAPSILRYRFNSLREAMYTDMYSQYEAAVQGQAEQEERGVVIPEENRIAMPSRQEIVNCLSRPHPKDDVLFGAHLVQGALRCMEPGAELLHSGVSDDALMRSSATTPTPQDRTSITVQSLAPANGASGPGRANANYINSFSSVSFECMPSIFLKGAVDLQMHLNRHQSSSVQSLGRTAQRPRHAFFTREFVSTVACGGDASCLFATTFTPEFLVGLGSFIEQPFRAVRSSIRATLHRLNVLLGTEVMRSLNPPAYIREHLRAPPLDINVVYLRENDLYVANTPGLASKLFFITNSLGAERLVLDLDDQYTASSTVSTNSASRRHLGDRSDSFALSMASSYSSITSMNSMAVFKMPTLERSHVDIAHLCTQVVTGPRHGGKGAGSPGIALFYHSCRGGLSENTVAMVPGDYHRSRRSRHHEGQSTTEPLLPLVVVTATTEFWNVMPSRVASDLLRALVLLNEEAMLFPHGGLAAQEAECRLRGTSAWTTTMESEYLERNTRMEHVLRYVRVDLADVFEPDVRERLCDFFRHRVQHFRELDTRNAQSMPEKLREKLEKAAEARQGQSRSTTSAAAAAAAAADAGPSTPTHSGVSNAGAGTGSGVGENGAYAQLVCDAIARALVIEAEFLAVQQQQQERDDTDDDDGDIAAQKNEAADEELLSATSILLGDVTAGSLEENHFPSAQRSGRRRQGSSAPKSSTRPSTGQHDSPFTVSVLVIPSAPIATRTNRRR